jgi:hypothetical protein
MVEYGHGVSEGAGTFGGSQGVGGGGGGDWGGQIVRMASDAADQISSLPPGQLLIMAAVIVVGLMVLRRAL